MSVATIANLPGVRPIVELGVGASYDSTSTAQWDVDRWDNPSAKWVGDKPFWYDVTCWVQDIATFAGRERAVDQFEVGTATITVDNRDGVFDFPLSLEDLADDPTLLSIRPGRSIRVGVQWDDGPATFLWAGYIDAANPEYDAVDGARMVLECIDAKGDAGRTEIASAVPAVGSGETVTARIGRILTAAGWPAYRRSIDTSGVVLIPTELGGQAVDLLNLAADSAGGTVYGDLGFDDGDPRVKFSGRDWANYASSAVPVGTIGDYGYPGVPEHYEWTVALTVDTAGLIDPTGVTTPDGPAVFDEDPDGSGLYTLTGPAGAVLTEGPAGLYQIEGGDIIPAVYADVCPSNWELSFARADISTRVLLSRRTDTIDRVYPTPAQLAVTANGTAAGLSMFGVETFARADLDTANTVDLDWYADRILTTRSWKYMPRVAAVTVTATGTKPETVNALINASPFAPARFRCQHKIDSRVVFNRVMMVTGVEHTITPLSWEARISLDDAEPFLIGGAHPALWDQAGIALWDTATWADPL